MSEITRPDRVQSGTAEALVDRHAPHSAMTFFAFVIVAASAAASAVNVEFMIVTFTALTALAAGGAVMMARRANPAPVSESAQSNPVGLGF